MPREQSQSAEQSQDEGYDEEYEVQEILAKRLTNKGLIYLIKWKGYPDPVDYTWEPLQHLTEVQHMITDFNQKLRNKPQKKSKPTQKLPKSSSRRINQEVSKSNSKKKMQVAGKGQQNQRQDKLKRGKKEISKHQPKSSQSSSQREESQKESQKEIFTKRNINKVKSIPTSKRQQNLKNIQQKDNQTLQWDSKYNLGRILNHYVKSDTLYFTIHLNDEQDKVASVIALTEPELKKHHFKKLMQYCEEWCKDMLIEQIAKQNTQQDEVQMFWKEIK